MQSPKRKIASSQWILAAAIGTVLVLVLSFGLDQWRHYRVEMAQAERATRGAAVILAEHTALTFDAVGDAVRAVRQLRLDALATGEPPAASHELLKALDDGSPVFRALAWIDKDGNRLASSLHADPPPINIAGLDHFATLRDREPDRETLYVAAPKRSKLLDQWIWMLPASLPVTGPDGAFAGIAGGIIDPGYLSRVYASIDLGSSAVVTLFRRDGMILAREPFDSDLLGETLAGRPFITDIVVQAPVGTFHDVGPDDGAERVIGYAVSPGDGFIVSVALRHDEVLAQFYAGLWEGMARLALIVLVLAVGTWFLVRQVGRREALALELQDSEVRFRDFAAASADWFWETDEEHRLKWISDTLGMKSGLSQQARVGRTIWEIVDPDSVSQAAAEDHRRALLEHLPFQGFCYARRTAQGRRWMMASGMPMFDRQGRFRGYRGSSSDITEQRRAETRLHEAIEAFPGDFMLFDPQGRLVFHNRHAERNMQAIGQPPQRGDTMEAILRRHVAAGALPDAARDPEGWIAWRLRQHRAPASRILVRFNRGVAEVIERRTEDGGAMVLRFDVTEQEAAREALQAAREAADAANRAKSDFLASMSHELRTPLNAIIGFGQLLQMNKPGTLTPSQLEHCDIIVRSGGHLLNLVDDVLDLSGIEAGGLALSLGPADVGALLAVAVATIAPAADDAGIAIDPVPALDVGEVLADRQRLLQILINLLSNAIKYNRPGGSVRLFAAMTDRGSVRIEVTDTGIGIQPADVDRLFVPFQRLGAEFSKIPGTGIGLALCKRLVEMMDGRIGVESRPDSGSTFWVELPLAGVQDRPAAVAVGRRGGSRTAAGHFSLLYVEDNPINRGLVGHILETLPQVTVHNADHGADGLDLARTLQPDIIVLDLNLPDMNGFEVLRQLQADRATAALPVIALTASAMPDDVRRGLRAGFSDYLTKPLDVGGFLAAIDAALAKRPGPQAAK
ncbi:MAG: ATP-binding protein [Sneathiellaceae bacterium]